MGCPPPPPPANLARHHEHLVLPCLGPSAYRHRRPHSLRFICPPNLTHPQGTSRDDFIHGLLGDVLALADSAGTSASDRGRGGR